MTNYFKTGLLALTLAFGVTSCDKQDNGGPAVSFLNAEIEGLTSKVTFGEDAGMAAPKGLKNLTAKNASEFTHLYGGESSQGITIKAADANGNAVGDAIFTGTYTPNDIANTLDPNTISLEHGKYIAETSNSSDLSAIVLGFLPYTSEVVFDIDADINIQLEAELLRGFVIVDALRANLGQRITSVTFSAGEITGNLIEDAAGDFYGYLEGGVYDVSIVYSLDIDPITFRSTIVNGQTLTIDPLLADEPVVVLSETVTSTTQVSTEADLAIANPGRDDSGDINGDGDNLDTIERLVTTTTQLADGVLIPSTIEVPNPVITRGAWSVTGNVTPTSDVTFDGEDGTGPNDGSTPVYVDREYSAWSPATAASDVENIDQTRVVTNVDGSFDPAIPAVLAQTIANSAYLTDEADEFVYGDFTGTGNAPDAEPEYGTWVTQGASDSSTATLTQTRSVVNVTAAYSYDQTRTVTILVNVREDATPLVLSDAVTSQTVNVPEARDAQDDATQMIANPAYSAVTYDAKDLDQDGDVDQADATAADFVATAAGAVAGWNLTYSAASGVTSVLISSQTINTYFFGVSNDPAEYAIVVDASRAQAYADAQVLAAYLVS